MAAPSKRPAPWREAFLSHTDEMDSPTFVLSTLHENGTSSATTPRVVPRARTVVFRGMWASLPVNPKNPADLNPEAYVSDLPAITTDARMEKVPELWNGARPDEQSGGGGPVEAVIWAAKSMTQWRIRGNAYVIGPDIESEGAAPVRQALAAHMRQSGNVESWSWSRELTAQFGNLSPTMRGTFKNPPPGTPVSESPGEGLGLGQKVEDLQDDIARRNFRVLVIVPEDVDRVDLSDSQRGRRWNYKLGSGGDGSWTTTELWP